MNNNLEQFSEERLKKISAFTKGGIDVRHVEIEALARIALSVKQAKQVALVVIDKHTDEVMLDISDEGRDLQAGDALYTTPQPAHTEQDGWIKCSEEFPDQNIDVQIYCSDTKEQFVGFHRGNGLFQFFNMNDVIGECEPTHWMPLPAAPKPESE